MITYNPRISQMYTWIKWAEDCKSFVGIGTVKTYDLNMKLISEETTELSKGKYE